MATADQPVTQRDLDDFKAEVRQQLRILRGDMQTNTRGIVGLGVAILVALVGALATMTAAIILG